MDGEGLSGPRRRAAAAVIAAGAAVAVAMALWQSDAGENARGNAGAHHLGLASQILRGNGFTVAEESGLVPDLFLRPTYTLLLVPVVAVFGDALETARVVCAALQGAMVGVAGLAAGGLLRRHGLARAAAVAPWLAVLDPFLASQAASFTDTALFTVLTVGALGLASWAAGRGGAGRAALAGLCLGLAVLTRFTAVTVAPWALWLLWRGCRARGTGGRALAACFVAFLAAAALAPLPWLARNHAVSGRWILSTVDGVNLWMGNNDHTSRFLDEGRSLDELPGRRRYDSLEQPTVAEQVAALDRAKAETSRWIREDPARAAALAVRKAGILWSPLVRPRSTRSQKADLKDRVGLLVWTPVLVAAAAGLYLLLRRRGPSRELGVGVLVTCAAFTAPHAIAWSGTRLRAPIDPLVMIPAACAVAAALSRRTDDGGTPSA